MLDNLRGQDSSPLFQDEDDVNDENFDPGLDNKKVHKTNRKFLGLSSIQTFILLIMMLLVVCMLGTMFLLVTGKIVPSFL
jgi:uncharacterized membrane protein